MTKHSTTTLCLAPLLALGLLTAGCEKKKEEAPGTAELAPTPAPKPVEADAALAKEPAVIGIIRKAEEQEVILRENQEKVNALPESAKQGPPPDPELQRLMTLQMEARTQVMDCVDRLKAYQGSPLELKLAAEYVRRSDLRRQVRVQGIIIHQAEQEKDAAKAAKAKELQEKLAADLKKSETEWQAVEQGGWRESAVR